MRRKEVEVVANENESRLTPCFVGFGDEEIHIGETAKHKAPVNMKNTIYQVKRLLGRMCDDKDVVQGMNSWGFDITVFGKVPLSKVEFHSKEREFCAEEVSAMIIRKMKEIAENHLQSSVSRAVISVPACFNDAQRTAVKNAGTIAGFSKVSLINEPTAAAIAYNLNIKERELHERILVFDLGAGTFDVSVCELNGNDLHVKASCGNAHFGGDDFNSRLVDYFVKEFLSEHGVDISQNKKAKFRLRYECEKAKKLLSVSNEVSIQLDCLSGDIDFRAKITRDVFEEINKDLFNIVKDTINRVLREADVKNHNGEFPIDQVIVVGGSSRIPKVREILADIFGQKKLNRMLNADEVVAMGASLAEEMIKSEEQKKRKSHFVDVISYSFFIEVQSKQRLLFEKNSENISPKKYLTDVNVPLIQGSIFQVLEETSKKQVLRRTFKVEYVRDSRLCINSDGIFSFNHDIVECTEDYARRLDDSQVGKMKKRAQDLMNENKEWLEKSKARNDLEKLVYTVQRNSAGRKYREKISPEQSKHLVGECHKILEWIENNKTAGIEEYVNRGQPLQTRWKSILSDLESENQKLSEEKKEDNGNHPKENPLMSNIQVEEHRNSFPVSTMEEPVLYSTERLIEDNTDVKNLKIVLDQPLSGEMRRREQDDQPGTHFQKDKGHGIEDLTRYPSPAIYKKEPEYRSTSSMDVANWKIVSDQPFVREMRRREQDYQSDTHFQKDKGHGIVDDPTRYPSSETHKREPGYSLKVVGRGKKVVSRKLSFPENQRKQSTKLVTSFSKREKYREVLVQEPTLAEIQRRGEEYNSGGYLPKVVGRGQGVVSKKSSLPENQRKQLTKFVASSSKEPTLSEIQRRKEKYNSGGYFPKYGRLEDYIRQVWDRVRRLPEDEYATARKEIHQLLNNSLEHVRESRETGDREREEIASLEAKISSILRRNGQL